jgi:hypothetical protein
MTDWLRHELEVSGRPAEVAAFRTAAAGANIVPWDLDRATLEESMVLLVAGATPRRASIAAARALAAQIGAAAETRHGILRAWIGRNHGCLLDLHALLPVPPAILRLGRDDPAADAWLWGHWGTTEPLRSVREIPARPGRRRGLARFRVEFFAADWTPWRALLAMRARWPSLRFEIWPDYDSGWEPSGRPDG